MCRRCGASVARSESEPAVAAAVIQPPRRLPILPLVVLTLLLLAAGLVVAGRIAWRALEARHHRDLCAGQLHKISVALKNYADEHGVYPPAVVRDSQGRPMHSWRALILPHLEKDDAELHKEYHYDEPWDGPRNRQLADRMPQIYRCPEDPAALDSQTSYLALVDGATGEFAAYPTGGGNAPPKSPPMTAYLVVEVAESGVGWMEPKDIALGKNSQPDKPLPAHFGYHVGGGVAVDEDGATIVLPDEELAKAIVAKPPPAAPAE